MVEGSARHQCQWPAGRLIQSTCEQHQYWQDLRVFWVQVWSSGFQSPLTGGLSKQGQLWPAWSGPNRATDCPPWQKSTWCNSDYLKFTCAGPSLPVWQCCCSAQAGNLPVTFTWSSSWFLVRDPGQTGHRAFYRGPLRAPRSQYIGPRLPCDQQQKCQIGNWKGSPSIEISVAMNFV